MRFLLADDEKISLLGLKRTLERLYPEADFVCANSYKTVLEHLGEDFTVAFLDIEMPVMNGIALAEKLREHNPEQNIIFVTAYDEYALSAYQLHASGYILKPYDADDIQNEMEHLRYGKSDTNKLLEVQCFGKFEVYYDRKPLHFERTGAKEILAYLVSLNGASATRDEICSTMWEKSVEVDRRKGYFRTLISSLRNTLKEYNAEALLDCQRNSYRIDPEMIECDYYHFLNGNEIAVSRFHGEFMNQYSWAEEMIGHLLDWEE